MLKKLKTRRASIMIEFALVMPIMLLLIVGIVEFSILFYDKAVLANASRAGARYGVVVRSPSYASLSSVQSYTATYCQNNLISFSTSPSQVVVTAVSSPPTPAFGGTLSVTVTYTYTDLLLHKFINHGQTYNLHATTVMTYE